MKKKVLFLTAAVAIMVLGGCSNSQEPTASETNAAVGAVEGNSKSIEYLSQKMETVDYIDEIMNDYMAENQGVSLVQTTTSGSVSVASRVAANDIPDMMNVYANTNYRVMAEEGIFKDLSGQAFLENISQEYLDTFTLEDGTVWAVPVTTSAFGLYINMDIYQEQGLEVPKTFDELLENCEKLKKAGITPFIFPYKDGGALRQLYERIMIGSVDHEFVKICEEVGNGDKSFADYPDVVEGFEAFIKLLDYADTDPLGTDTNDVANAFANGEVAMVMNGSWGCSQYASLNPDLNFEVVVFPTITAEETYVVGAPDIVIAISSTTENAEECERFIDYFVSDEVAEAFAEKEQSPNLLKNVTYENEKMSDVCGAIAEGKFKIAGTVDWPAAYPDMLKGELQQFVMDRDVEAFIQTIDAATKEIYNQE